MMTRILKNLWDVGKRQNRDSTAFIWNPRTILQIKEEIAASQDMTDVATDHHTPKGFQSYTVLRESMRCKSIMKLQNASDNFEMKVQYNSALTKPECEESKERRHVWIR